MIFHLWVLMHIQQDERYGQSYDCGVERTFEMDIDRELFTELTANLPPTLERVIAGVADTVAAISLTIRR